MFYFLRHGDAEDGNGDDAARELTAKGERQARAAGKALVATGRRSRPASPAEVTRLTGGRLKLRKGGLAIVEGSELKALLRPADLAALAANPY